MKVDLRRIVRPFITCVVGTILGSLLTLLPSLQSAPVRPVIAFIPRTSGTNFTEDMHRGADAAAASQGYKIYWNAPTRSDDVDRQIRIAEGAVDRGAKAVILGPTNPGGVTTLIDDFDRRKVPVVIVQTESPVPTSRYVTSVTPDQAEFGRIGALRIAKILAGRGQVAIVGLNRGTPETLVRARIFTQAIAPYPGIEVVAQSPGSVQTLEAEQSTREIMNSFPDLKAIFAVSADATQGALLALQDTNRAHSIALVGCDRDLFLVQSMLAGKIDSLVAADGYRIGFLAVQAALEGARGQRLPAPQHVGAELLTKNHIVFIDNH